MRRFAGSGTRSMLLVAIAAATAPLNAEAQYFGRNKVQYQTFDFRVMSTQHYDLHYYPAESLATADAARMAERWYTRLSGIMRQNFNKKPLVFYADHPDFEQTNVIGGFIDQSTGGVTESLRDRVIMPFTGVYAENDHVLGHEMVHVFQYDIAASPTGGGSGQCGGAIQSRRDVRSRSWGRAGLCPGRGLAPAGGGSGRCGRAYQTRLLL